MCLGGVPELLDQGMALERLLHDAALHALAAAMNQSNLAQAGSVRSGHVFLDHRRDLPWGEGVEIEATLDRNAVRHLTWRRCRRR